MSNPKKYSFFFFICLFLFLFPKVNFADEQIYTKRLSLYKKTEAITQIPWYYIAAIDQYERNIDDQVDSEQLISITIEDELWFGIGNHSLVEDTHIITMFDGIGQDGNGNGRADPTDPEDVLFTIATYMLSYGQTADDFKIALWNYYNRDLTVQTIVNTAKVFKYFNEINLTERDFPLATNYNYSYRSTWGHGRGFGGARIHEGTDIFASYGTPVHSTTYGVIEMMGWNLYGGWRIGIRDIHNIYHYYGHLNGYSDFSKVGQIVQPGDVLGTVGSSGYGPPGTAGKFPPHLHYGMYKDNGYSEWSFDPYPYLRRWEQMSRSR